MGNVKIYTPVKGFTGHSAGVDFKDGVGEIDADNPSIRTYFQPAGYIVGKEDDRAGALPGDGVVNVPPVKGAGDGPMIEQVVAIEAEAEDAAAPARAKKAATK